MLNYFNKALLIIIPNICIYNINKMYFLNRSEPFLFKTRFKNKKIAAIGF